MNAKVIEILKKVGGTVIAVGVPVAADIIKNKQLEKKIEKIAKEVYEASKKES